MNKTTGTCSFWLTAAVDNNWRRIGTPDANDLSPEEWNWSTIVDLTHGAYVVRVFFYGLFMDERLLATKGIVPSEVRPGFLDGYRLRIGERATLVRRPGSRAYGTMMKIAPSEATELYAEDSVADYLPEPVVVELTDGTQVDATCYNLPADKISGANKKYAESLLEVATRLSFPDSYLDEIRQARN